MMALRSLLTVRGHRIRQFRWQVAAVAVVVALWVIPGAELWIASTTNQGPAYESHATAANTMPLVFEPGVRVPGRDIYYSARGKNGRIFFASSELVLRVREHTSLADVERQGKNLYGPVALAPVSKGAEARLDIRPELAAIALGQSAARPQETARAGGSTIQTLRLRFHGASSAAYIEPQERLTGRVNYMLGNDPAQWESNLPTYGALTYRQLYPGVDLTYNGTPAILKGTYDVAPHSDPTAIRWRYEGAKRTSLDAHGNLRIEVACMECAAETELIERAPVAWQDISGQRLPVEAKYEISSDGTIGFILGAYNPAYPLIIDPELQYSSFIGGSTNQDTAHDIAADNNGNVYLVGTTESVDFPIENEIQSSRGRRDVYVTKLNTQVSGVGSLQYSTYIGGVWDDIGHSIAIDQAGNVYIAGQTGSGADEFPLRNAYQSNRDDDFDAFVTKLNSSGSELLYSTFIAGNSLDIAYAVAADGAGNVYVAGTTISSNFPVRSQYQNYQHSPNQRASDVFLTKINTLSAGDASLVYSTYIGGSTNYEVARGLAIDNAGHAYVAGYTGSSNYPTRNNLPNVYSGSYEAFLTRINTLASGNSSLVYSTYLGGNDYDFAYGVTVGAPGVAYVAGDTSSTNFPTQNASQLRKGPTDAFVSKLNTNLSGNASLLYSSYLGGSGYDTARSIAVDSSGGVYVIGYTGSQDFPAQNSYDEYKGNYDAFVTKLNTESTGEDSLVYSSFFGGSNSDFGYGIAVGAPNEVYMCGYTYSTDLPLAAEFQSITNGGADGFVAKLDLAAENSSTPVPAPISADSNDQQAPSADGAIVVWEEYQDGNWNILAKNITKNQQFTVYTGNGDQRHPQVSGNLVTWQDNRDGNWDIYAARLSNVTAAPPFPIYVGAGNQINPAVSRDLVIWQTDQADSLRWDIVGMDLAAAQAFTLTTSAININPDIDATHGPLGISTWVVWQTRGSTGSNWAIAGSIDITKTNPITFAITDNQVDHQNPDVSDGLAVWQEYVSSSADPSAFRWRISGAEIDSSADPTGFHYFNVEDDDGDQTDPSVRGDTVVYQDSHTHDEDAIGGPLVPERHGRWTIIRWSFRHRTRVKVSDTPGDATRPTYSGTFIVWQQASAGIGTAPDLDTESDIYGNVGFEVPAVSPTPTRTATVQSVITPGSCTVQFSDVGETTPFYSYVRCLACEQVMSGYPCGEASEPCMTGNHPYFRPNNLITRGQIAKIVSNAAGLSGGPQGQLFQDVPTNSTFFPWINRLAAEGHMSGYPCGQVEGEPCMPPGNLPYFRPGANATRGQLSKIVSNAAGFSEAHTGQAFEDVPAASPFYIWIQRLSSRRHIGGYPCGQSAAEPCVGAANPYFRPNNPVTRGQAAKIAANALVESCAVPGSTVTTATATASPVVQATGQPSSTPPATATATATRSVTPSSTPSEAFTLTNPTLHAYANRKVNVTVVLHSNTYTFLGPDTRGDHLYAIDDSYGAWPVQTVREIVSPGQEYAFHTTMVAPSVPGTYTSHWRMKVGGFFVGPVAEVTLIVTQAPPSELGWYARYFRDLDFREECQDGYKRGTFIFEDWKQGAPAQGCPVDDFTVRLARTFYFEGGDYRFHCQHRGGCRLRVAGQQEAWWWEIAEFEGHDLYVDELPPGNYEVVVEYFNHTGDAKLEVWWQGTGFLPKDSACDANNNWCGQYWGNRATLGTSALMQSEGAQWHRHDWGAGGPGFDLPTDNFSGRWIRKLSLACGSYRFHVVANDGVRLWVNNSLLINEWQERTEAAEFTANGDVPGGTVEFRLEYFEGTGQAEVDFTAELLSACPATTLPRR